MSIALANARSRRRLGLWVAPALCVLALTSAAQAQMEGPTGVIPAPANESRPREDTYETPRGLGMGMGGRAGVSGTSAVAYNAANMPLASVYHVETIFGYLAGENAFVTGGAIADAISSRVAAGLAMRGVFGGGSRDFSGWDGRLSLGMPLADAISIGVSARYLRLRADERTADGQPVGEEARGFTMDAAVRVTPMAGLHLAALAYNLVDRNSSLAPVRVGGGAAYSFREMFSVGFDALVDLSTFDSASVVMGGGAEYSAGGLVPIRLGFQYDTGRSMSSLTAGLGYSTQEVGVELSLRQDFGTYRASQLLLGLRYSVQ